MSRFPVRHALKCTNPRQTLISHMRSGVEIYPKDFTLWLDFLTPPEQQTLLRASLSLLDSAESRQHQRRRKKLQGLNGASTAFGKPSSVQALFQPDEYYQFAEEHYDGVIRHFREMHVTSWPETDSHGLRLIVDRLLSLCPSKNVQTHLLHLASHGEILPHVDNVQASGSWILGVSLGAQRIMRMQCSQEENNRFDVLLPSGSVYLQRDAVRFDYTHSILKDGAYKGQNIDGGQRLSVMIRDRLP